MWTQTSQSVGLRGMLLRGYQDNVKCPHRTWSGALFPICGPGNQIQGVLLLGLDKNFLPPLLGQSLLSVLMAMPAPTDR